jgi:hypothetical protein
LGHIVRKFRKLQSLKVTPLIFPPSIEGGTNTTHPLIPPVDSRGEI